MLLASGQRAQTPLALRVDGMEITASAFVFQIKNLDIKHGRIGYKAEPIKFKAFPVDRRIRVYNYVTEHLKRTLNVRGKEKRLLLMTVKPHVAISRDTLSRWVKLVLKKAGINTDIFKAGSTRVATVSKAALAGTSLEEIMRGAGWSRQTTFTKWYKREVKSKKICRTV